MGSVGASIRSVGESPKRPVKITVPGPLSIIDTTANSHYASERDLAFDLGNRLFKIEIGAHGRDVYRFVLDRPKLYAAAGSFARGWCWFTTFFRRSDSTCV